MIAFLRKLAPAKLRHRMVRLFPRFIRHRIVNIYISRQQRIFENNRQKLGLGWIESVPGWTSISSDIAGKDTAEYISAFWENVPKEDVGNSPICYAHSTIHWDIDLLKGHVDRLLVNKGVVLDFGCNVGRVLHCFVEDGYEGIGVEINKNAIEYGKKTFPSLEKVKFYIGDGPEALKNIRAHSVDLIYTSAVLRHIAPEKIDLVIVEFSRIGPKYIITLEDEASLSYRTFPHNYRSKFAANGWREIHKEYAIDYQSFIDIGGLGSVLRVYEKKA